MLKNHEKRLTRVEDSTERAHERVDKHDVVFATLQVTLDYMREGIDELKEGQKELRESNKHKE